MNKKFDELRPRIGAGEDGAAADGDEVTSCVIPGISDISRCIFFGKFPFVPDEGMCVGVAVMGAALPIKDDRNGCDGEDVGLVCTEGDDCTIPRGAVATGCAIGATTLDAVGSLLNSAGGTVVLDGS